MRVKKRQQKAREKKVIALVSAGVSNKRILEVLPELNHNQVSKIKMLKKDDVQAKKEKYIKLIDKATGGDYRQSSVLAKCLKAKTDIYNFKGDVVGSRPDHKIRLETIKYIDKLKSRDTSNNVQLKQTNNYISNDLDRYIK